MPAAPKILVIRRRYLGDIVLLGSFLRNLKLHWPDARISVLCERNYAGVLELNPDVAEGIPFPNSIGEWLRTIRRLRAARFTHVFDLDNRDKTAVLARVTGAAMRVTQRHIVRLHLPSFYTASERLAAEFLDDRHITDLYLRLLEFSGVPVRTRESRLVPLASDLEVAETFWRADAPEGAKRFRLLVHPGSRSLWRVWPPERFAAVIDQLHRAHGIQVGVVAGPGEQATVDEIFRHLHAPAIRMPSNLNVPQLGALFASADLFLCHDSGPMHLAAAVGTRVVALFGSQTLSHWRPLGAEHATLQPPLPCVNCVSPGKCNPNDPYFNHCVRNISTERVIVAVREAIQAR